MWQEFERKEKSDGQGFLLSIVPCWGKKYNPSMWMNYKVSENSGLRISASFHTSFVLCTSSILVSRVRVAQPLNLGFARLIFYTI